jgi:hypothetical protein
MLDMKRERLTNALRRMCRDGYIVEELLHNAGSLDRGQDAQRHTFLHGTQVCEIPSAMVKWPGRYWSRSRRGWRRRSIRFCLWPPSRQPPADGC